jgi:hypothetical protein
MQTNEVLTSSELIWAYERILSHVVDEPLNAKDNLEFRTRIVNLIRDIGQFPDKVKYAADYLRSQRNGHTFDDYTSGNPLELASMIYVHLQANMYPLAKNKSDTLTGYIAALNRLAMGYEDVKKQVKALASVIRTQYVDHGNRESVGPLCSILDSMQY